MVEHPRLRLAPSPTGSFHLGTARTALYNWLHCKQTGGTFILRIEDTDAERNRPEHVDTILRALEWLALGFDEGPYFQSASRDRHISAASDLAERGLAYWSDPMPTASDGKPIAYDGRDRDKGLEQAPGRALRFRVPPDGATTVVDLVRGEPTFEHRTIEDFALLRGNGEPLFILSNVVDDLDQRITHVLRGEEHLPNTPKYQLLWKALAPAEPVPLFAHLPLLVNEQRKKLSKRRDKVGLEIYQADGYLPETMTNVLALCGWGPSDGDERLDLDRLVAEFRLENVVSSPSYFDLKKLDAFNGQRIREMSVADFSASAGPWLRDEVEERPTPWKGRAVFRPERWEPLAGEVRDRVVKLADPPVWVDFLMLDEPDWVDSNWDKAVRQAGGPEATASLLTEVCNAWSDAATAWEPESLGAIVHGAAEFRGLSKKKGDAPVRVAITGRSVGPPLWESVVVLGREESVGRLEAALARLG